MSVQTAIQCDCCGRRWATDDVVPRTALYMRSGFVVSGQDDMCADCLAALRNTRRPRADRDTMGTVLETAESPTK